MAHFMVHNLAQVMVQVTVPIAALRLRISLISCDRSEKIMIAITVSRDF